MAKRISPEIQEILSAMNAGYWATSAGLLEKFLKENPESVKGWIDYGQSLGHLGRYPSAKQALMKAAELSETSEADAIYGLIGHQFRSQGQFDQALEWYQKQSDTSPQDATGRLFAGNIFLNRGDHAQAIQAFQQALTCDEGCFEEVYYSLGMAYLGQSEYTHAIQAFEKSLAIDSDFVAAKTALKDAVKAKSQTTR